MTTDAFWDIDAGAKANAGGVWERRTDTFADLLERLPPAEIVEFERNFREQRARAYTWDLWGAGYILGGGCSDDGFMDFRAWLISMGKEVFETAHRDPDSLAEIKFGPESCQEEDVFFEEYAYIPMEVYEKVTGEEMPMPEVWEADEPVGTAWDEEGDGLAERFPRLWAQNS